MSHTTGSFLARSFLPSEARVGAVLIRREDAYLLRRLKRGQKPKAPHSARRIKELAVGVLIRRSQRDWQDGRPF